MDKSGDSTVAVTRFPVPWSGFGHRTSVSSAIAISGGRILSWNNEPSLWLWDADGNALAALYGPAGPILGALESADGHLVSWGNDPVPRMWDAGGEALGELVGHTDDVWGVRNLADGDLLSWSKDNTLRLWNSSGEPIATLAGHTGAIAGARELSDGRIISWGDKGNVRLWSPAGRPRRVLGELRDGADPNTDVAFDVSLLCFTDGCVSAGCSCTPDTSCSWYTNPATGGAVVRWYPAAGAHSRAAETILTDNTGLVRAVYDAAQGAISRLFGDDPPIRIQRAGGE